MWGNWYRGVFSSRKTNLRCKDSEINYLRLLIRDYKHVHNRIYKQLGAHYWNNYPPAEPEVLDCGPLKAACLKDPLPPKGGYLKIFGADPNAYLPLPVLEYTHVLHSRQHRLSIHSIHVPKSASPRSSSSGPCIPWLYVSHSSPL